MALNRSAPALLAKLGIEAQPKTFEAYVDAWSAVTEATKALVEHEKMLRAAIAASAFPEPSEGTNKFNMADGRVLTMTHKINRKVDETQVALARSEYDLANDRPVTFDELLKFKPELVVSAYRKLTPGSAAFLAVSRCVTAKPGLPTLDIK